MAVGGRSGCEAVFTELGVRAYSGWSDYPTHRLVVDCYALQHPEPYCHSAKSLAAHLTGVCVALEHGGDPSRLRAVQRWLDGPRRLERPEPPRSRGRLTIVDVRGAGSGEAFAGAVRRWAAAVGEAWREHHATARAWVIEARSVQLRDA